MKHAVHSISKVFTLFLLTLLVYANGFAQPVLKWQRTIGGNNDDLFSCMNFTKDGGLIAGGYSFSNKSGEKTQDAKGQADYWIVKLDSSGKVQWNKTIGGNFSDWLTVVKQTKDGGYILGGYSWSLKSGDKTENPRGNYDEDLYPDYWVVKLDSQANIEWDKTIGGNNYDALTALEQTKDGGYILGGYSNSGAGCEKSASAHREYFNEPHNDYWIVKLDRKGNIEWDKTMGGVWRDWLTCLQQTNDGGYILGGYSESDSGYEKTQNSRGYGDYWIVKVDNAGKIQWDKTIGGDDEDDLYSLEQTSDGGYVLGGTSTSGKSGEKTQKNRGETDYWVVKLNKSGAIQWDKTIGGNDFDDCRSIQQTCDGGYITGGSSASNISGEKTENNRGVAGPYGFYDDYWVVKLNKSGRVEWDKTIGGDVCDICKSVKEISKNHYVAGGYSSSDISGDKTQKSRGAADYWLVKLVYKKPLFADVKGYNEGTIVTEKSDQHNFIVYPNPVKDVLRIEGLSKESIAIISIVNMQGKVVLQTTTLNSTCPLNVTQLVTGTYFVKINQGQKTHVAKVVKE